MNMKFIKLFIAFYISKKKSTTKQKYNYDPDFIFCLMSKKIKRRNANQCKKHQVNMIKKMELPSLDFLV
jgi:hypothetical protein